MIAPAFADSAYSIIPLDAPAGLRSRETAAYTINDRGDVGGYSFDFDQSSYVMSATIWRHDGSQEVVAQSPFVDGGVTAINAAGRAVGYVAVPTEYAFTYQGFNSHGGNIDLYPLVGSPGAFAPYGVNDAGVVVGIGDGRAAMNVNGVTTILNDAAAFDGSAMAVNNAGVIVGWFSPDPFVVATRAFKWSDGAFTVLPSAGGNFDAAVALNDAGVIVGGSRTPDGRVHAAVWQDMTLSLLALPDASSRSIANAVNNRGDIVGTVFGEDGRPHAVLWSAGMPHQLDEYLPTASGWNLQYAYDINNSGQIVGQGIYNGQQAAFVLSPPGLASIPEPISGLLCAGAVAVLTSRCRSRVV